MYQKGFVTYYSYLETMEDLTNEEFGSLIRAALEYGKTGKIPELKGNEKILFKTIKFQIDQDAEKYKNKCEKNKENVEKRWNQADASVYEHNDKEETNTNGYKRIQSNKKNTNHTNINENENENESENNKKVSTSVDTKKDAHTKKAYGSAENVLLTDEQHTKLQSDYGSDLLEMVEYLSDYIAKKGGKIKKQDHNRVLRGWVKDAVREQKLKQQELKLREKELEARQKRLESGYSCQKSDTQSKTKLDTSTDVNDWI